ncbi:MAG: hypothetical protein E7562_00430 [Ruminococcaceae bacterium]|nr:hypothetical protein [Oscillospiraceae bacterium]
MRKILSLLIVFTLIVTFAACGDTEIVVFDSVQDICEEIGKNYKGLPYYGTDGKNIEFEESNYDDWGVCEIRFLEKGSRYVVKIGELELDLNELIYNYISDEELESVTIISEIKYSTVCNKFNNKFEYGDGCYEYEYNGEMFIIVVSEVEENETSILIRKLF